MKLMSRSQYFTPLRLLNTQEQWISVKVQYPIEES